IGGLAVSVVYLALCVGGMVWFRRVERNYNPILHFVVPLIGLVGFGFGVYGSIYPGAALTMPLAIIPWVVLGWIILGIVIVASLRRSHAERVAQIGSILGEDDGAAERRRNDGPRRAFQELLTVRLAARLGCDPDDVPTARAEASEDWPAYCAGLFADSGITDLVLDAGFSPEAEAHLDDYA